MLNRRKRNGMKPFQWNILMSYSNLYGIFAVLLQSDLS